MTEITNGIYEDSFGNLVDVSGKVLVPKEKRTRAEVFSRIVGYLRPVSLWNKGKKAEWSDRVDFDEKKSVEDAEQRQDVPKEAH